MPYPHVTHGCGEILVADDGVEYVDLIAGTGAVLLGHANTAVNARVVQQLGRLSCSWTSSVDIWDECVEVVDRHVGGGLRLFQLHTSGTEAVEVAMRLAVHQTGRSAFVGFGTNHHGRSIATQGITDRDEGIPVSASLHSIPFLPDRSPEDVLADLDVLLATRTVGAVLVEPMQGKGGGHEPGAAFLHELGARCRAAGTLVICDEVFTGFHRTGACLLHRSLGLDPDVVVVGKAMSNGFPASGILLRPGIDLHPKDPRLSSTFSGNPLACAAVIGAVREMERIGVEDRVAAVERSLRRLPVPAGGALRLRGAACFLDVGGPLRADAVASRLLAHRVLSVRRGTAVGLFPPATIPLATLDHVVDLVTARLEEIG